MWVHLCSYCQKRLSLGLTEEDLWLGCVICQGEVDEAVESFLEKKFG